MPERLDLKKESSIPHQLIELEEPLRTYVRDVAPLEDFRDIVPMEEISADMAEVAQLKKIFEEKDSPEDRELHAYAQVLEMIVMEFSNAWLPGYLSKASEYDDIKRKTDLFLEIEDDAEKVMRLALDVTSSRTGASKKIKEVLGELKQGSFHAVKYFKSELDESMGQQEMPRFIIGADVQEISELASLYVRLKQASSGDIRASVLNEIRNHRFGEEMQDELIYQARRFVAELKRSPTPSVEKIALLSQIEAAVIARKKEASTHERDHMGSRELKTNGVLEAISEAVA